MGELIAQFRNQITPNETVSPIDDGQASHLMHTLELLTIRQSEIQQKLRESTVEMLDKLKAIDSLATMQVNMRSRNSEINDLVGQFRKQISLIDHRTQLQK
jgi:hypothetical protein